MSSYTWSFFGFLEKRLPQASIERPKKYHHTVPRTPHKAKATHPFLREPNVMLEARTEMGKSANQRSANKSNLALLCVSLSKRSQKAYASTNKHACTAGAANRGRMSLLIAKTSFRVPNRSAVFECLLRASETSPTVRSCTEGRQFSTDCALKVPTSQLIGQVVSKGKIWERASLQFLRALGRRHAPHFVASFLRRVEIGDRHLSRLPPRSGVEQFLRCDPDNKRELVTGKISRYLPTAERGNVEAAHDECQAHS